ncbi:MAG: hypothetical protein ACYC1L_17320 [Alphaproteobacteria bacterium]
MSVHAVHLTPETRTGLLGSLALHLLFALLLLFLAPKLVKAPRPVESVLPVEIVELAPPAAPSGEVAVPRPAPPREAPARPRALPHLPEQPRAEMPKPSAPPAPEAPPSIAGLNMSLAPPATGTAGAGARPRGMFDVKDLIREQIERHWVFDRQKLPQGDRTVLLRVVINRDGTVAEAEILDEPRHGLDPAYQALARSARNAALLASPLTVPPERYNEVKEITLRMNPALVSR